MRHPRTRPRSCQACGAAKSKCSFEVPCSRCRKRGIGCVYESAVAQRRASPGHAPVVGMALGEPSRRKLTTLASGARHADDPSLLVGDFAFADSSAVNNAQNRDHSGDLHSLCDLTTQTPSIVEPLTFEQLFALEDDISPQHRCWTDLSLASQDDLDLKSPHWCAWTRGNVSLAVVAETSMVSPEPNVLSGSYSGRSHTQHNADLIIQSLRSFPTMMIRKETFPWFIHPRSMDRGEAVPSEALSNCMSIAQMFSSRTSETRSFLRRTVGAEHRRLQFEVRLLLDPCSSKADWLCRCTRCPNSNSLPRCKLA